LQRFSETVADTPHVCGQRGKRKWSKESEREREEERERVEGVRNSKIGTVRKTETREGLFNIYIYVYSSLFGEYALDHSSLLSLILWCSLLLIP